MGVLPAEMNRRKGWYDPDFLETLQAVVLKIDTGFMFRMAHVKELTTGMIIRDGIRTTTGNCAGRTGARDHPADVAED